MHGYRDVWMQQMLARDMRMVDAQIMASLQNGTAFFASTSLIAIGGTLTLLRSTDDLITIVRRCRSASRPRACDVGDQDHRARHDLRLCVLQIRLVVPAVQLCRDHDRRDAAASRTQQAVGQNFTPCAPASFASPPAGISTAASAPSFSRSAISAGSSVRGCSSCPPLAIFVVMWRRQFASDSRAAR